MEYKANLGSTRQMDRSTLPSAPPLPFGLPDPIDDGAADHLCGRPIPAIRLPSTSGDDVDMASLAERGLVLYVFPGMGPPEKADPEGWNDIPGAYGCTQQSCAFRDRDSQFQAFGYTVVGLSAQSPEQQREAHARLRLGFQLVADPDRRFGDILALPTFSADDMTLYRRLTLVARGGNIVKVFYPVFPPDENAEEVLAWLASGVS